jgi:hypothetical protein
MWFILIVAILALSHSSCGGRNIDGEAAARPERTPTRAPNKNVGKGVSKEAQMNEDTYRPVRLQAAAEDNGDTLTVSYGLTNESDQLIYVWDQIVDYSSPEPKIDHDGAYIFFEEPATIRLIRANLPLPEAFDIARKPIPYARALEPRGTLSGVVRLKHPVHEYSPYFEPLKDEESKTEQITQVRLIIGWTTVKPGMKIDERTVGAEKAFAIRGAWAPPYQETLEQRMPIKTRVETYTTDFERMMPLR